MNISSAFIFSLARNLSVWHSHFVEPSAFRRTQPTHQYLLPHATRACIRSDAPQRGARGARESASAEALETNLLESVNVLCKTFDGRVHDYTKNEILFKDAFNRAEELEDSGRSGFGSSSGRMIGQIEGSWRLIFTDNQPVIKNAGSITGLGALPFAKCAKVVVTLERNGKARTEETVSVLNGLVSGVNSLLGKWRLGGKTGRRLEVTYAEALLLGRTKLRADSKAVLETTYCGERLRIGRGASGSIFVFEREE